MGKTVPTRLVSHHHCKGSILDAISYMDMYSSYRFMLPVISTVLYVLYIFSYFVFLVSTVWYIFTCPDHFFTVIMVVSASMCH